MKKHSKLAIDGNMGFVPRHILLTLQNYNCGSKRQFLNKLIEKRLLNQTLQKINEWSVVNLDLWFAKEGVIESIKEIQFRKLRILNLCFDCIESIEGLSRLNAPKIEVIWLKNNKLVSITSLRKIKSQKLTQLWISNNLVNQIQAFSEINWNCPKYIGIESYVTCYQSQNITALVKTPSHHNQQFQLSVNAKQRIRQLKLISAINKKYPSERAVILSGLCLK